MTGRLVVDPIAGFLEAQTGETVETRLSVLCTSLGYPYPVFYRRQRGYLLSQVRNSYTRMVVHLQVDPAEYTILPDYHGRQEFLPLATRTRLYFSYSPTSIWSIPLKQ